MLKKFPPLQCLFFSAFSFGIVVSAAPAADWRGTADGNFQIPENWQPEARNENWEAPVAGGLNRTFLAVQNGPDFPLSYTGGEGDTQFSGQLLVGGNRGPSGELTVSGGMLTVNTDNRGGAIVGQTVEGTLRVSGGILNLRPGADNAMPAGLPSSWGLIIGNESSGIGVVEVSGGEVNVGGGLWLGRRSGTGSLVVSGSGHFVCEGPVLFGGGLNVQKIELGKDGGNFEVNLNGDLHFPSEGGTNGSYIDFPKGSKGRISLAGKDRGYFESLVAEGRIRIDGSVAKVGQFVFRKDGNTGVYSLLQ